MSAVRTEGLRHRYTDREVLDGLSLEVPAGSIFGLIGANGAGKTTTLRILSTLLYPTAGRVTIAGHDVVREPTQVRRVIGYMPDSARVDDRLTVLELLEFYAAVHGIAPASRGRAVGTVVDLCRLGALRDRLVVGLSKGVRQRLLLARTLLNDPLVLLLDEPASDLDPRARSELKELLLAVRSMGKTIVLSSHILSELEQVCDAVAIVERGRLVAAGPLGTLFCGLRGRERTLRVRVLGRAKAAAACLEGAPGVAARVVDDMQLSVTIEGSEERQAETVRRLVEAGVAVLSVEPERGDLERAFLELTQGEVQ